MIKKISIKNVKSTPHGVYDVDKLNLLIGKNGAGKSTIMDSIAIAMEGKHPRNGNTLVDIMNICPCDSLEVELNVQKVDEHSSFKRTFDTDEKGSNRQVIYVNNRKVKKHEGEAKIKEWFGEFLPRVNIAKFIGISANDKGKFLFTLFGDKLNNLTTNDLEQIILYALIRKEVDFQGIVKFDLKKDEDDLTEDEKTDVFNKTINKMKSNLLRD